MGNKAFRCFFRGVEKLIIDTPKTIQASDVWQFITPDYALNTGANTIIPSALGKSTGFGVSIVAKTPSILIHSAFYVQSGGSIAIYRSTIGIPAVNSSPNTGDVELVASYAFSSAQNCVLTYIDTGLTIGTTYYYYLVVVSGTAGSTGIGVLTAAYSTILGQAPYGQGFAGYPYFMEALKL